MCYLHERSNEAFATGGFATLAQVARHLNLFSNSFGVLIQQQIQQIGRNFIFVISTANRNRQCVQSTVGGYRHRQYGLGVLTDGLFLEGKLNAFRSIGNGDFTGSNYERNVLVTPADNQSFLLGGEHSRGIQTLEHAIRIGTHGKGRTFAAEVLASQSLENSTEGHLIGLGQSTIRNVGVSTSVGFTLKASTVSLVEGGVDLKS